MRRSRWLMIGLGILCVGTCALLADSADPFPVKGDAQPSRRVYVLSEPENVLQGEDAVSPAFFQEVPPLAPAPSPLQITPEAPAAAARFSESVFGGQDVERSLLSQVRRRRARGPSTSIVFGREGAFRATTDAGSLLGKSVSTPGVATQSRTSVVTDPRVRSSRAGRLLASGSYWAPARQDLDTLLSKIDSRILENVLVIKGPYSVRYGPGADFIDFQLLSAPRYAGGFESHGSTSLEYQTNGKQWYGRQAVWAGAEDWGARVGYGHRTGNDYEAGGGFELPTSYKSRDLDLALGVDLTQNSNLEFTYLRLDQTDVEFPALVYDINFLVTDAFELKYVVVNQEWFDRLEWDGWYNRTRFEGDTSRAGKQSQIPTLNDELGLADGQFATTDVDGASAGHRAAFSWADDERGTLTAGTDLIFVSQQLNDIVPRHFDAPFLVDEKNFPIPRSSSTDVGLFLDHVSQPADDWTMTLGSRFDYVATDARENVPGMGELVVSDIQFVLVNEELPLSEIKQADVNQLFYLWSLFGVLEHQVDDHWVLSFGAGRSERPPTLTELYAERSFIGSLQPGLTFVEGDPELDAEKRVQIDVGVRGSYERFRLSASGFYAWLRDYIILEDVDSFVFGGLDPGQELQHAVYGNTERALLSGFEVAAEHDLNKWLSAFATMSYVEGRDLSRSKPTRLGELRRAEIGFAGEPRSGFEGNDHEPLAGIPPLDTRLGLRLHDPAPVRRWGIELESRIVDDQDRVAESVFEQPTPGFTVWNLRGFAQPKENLLLIAGVENFTDKLYQEHLDYRSGLGFFRPGVNFYVSSELTY